MARSLKVGAQGRIVLPAAIRRTLGLDPGDEVAARIEGRRLVLERPADLLSEMRDELRNARGTRSLADELIEERRREASLELRE